MHARSPDPHRRHRRPCAPTARTTWTRVFEQCQDPASQRWTTVPTPYTRDGRRAFVREVMPSGWAARALGLRGRGRRPVRRHGRAARRGLGPGRDRLRLAPVGPRHRRDGARLPAAGRLGLRRARACAPWSGTPTWATGPRAGSPGGWGSPSTAPCASTSCHRGGELVDAWAGTLLATDDRAAARRRGWRPRLLEGDGSGCGRGGDRRRSPDRRGVPATSARSAGSAGCRRRTPYGESDARVWLEHLTEEAGRPGRTVALGGHRARRRRRSSASVNFFDLEPGRGCEIGYWAHPGRPRTRAS